MGWEREVRLVKKERKEQKRGGDERGEVER